MRVLGAHRRSCAAAAATPSISAACSPSSRPTSGARWRTRTGLIQRRLRSSARQVSRSRGPRRCLACRFSVGEPSVAGRVKPDLNLARLGIRRCASSARFSPLMSTRTLGPPHPRPFFRCGRPDRPSRAAIMTLSPLPSCSSRAASTRWSSAALAREAGYRLLALSIDYNQRHRVELAAARRVAARARRRAPRRAAARPVGVRRLGADRRHRRAQGRRRRARHPRHLRARAQHHLPVSLALGWAEAAGARDLFIGVNALDYSGYPDCRPEFIAAFEALAELATKAGVEGEPFRIQRAAAAHDQGRHRARGRAAGARHGAELVVLRSDAGRAALRAVRQLPAARKGFVEAGVADPTRLARRSRPAMSYAVKEMFLTLQGEGVNAGRARGVRALRRLQSVVGARAGPRDRGVPLLRHRFRRHRRRGRRQVRRCRRAGDGGRRASGARARATASSC